VKQARERERGRDIMRAPQRPLRLSVDQSRFFRCCLAANGLFSAVHGGKHRWRGLLLFGLNCRVTEQLSSAHPHRNFLVFQRHAERVTQPAYLCLNAWGSLNSAYLHTSEGLSPFSNPTSCNSLILALLFLPYLHTSQGLSPFSIPTSCNSLILALFYTFHASPSLNKLCMLSANLHISPGVHPFLTL
jgi:hypothetical protein